MKTLDETLRTVKSARLEIKTTDFAKEFIKKAATISGLDMSSFIMASAFEKAEAVIENHRRIEVSEQAFSRLQQILLEDETAAPTSALLRLMRGQHENRRDANM
ncbi:DUF1778 domain-containing protein [Pseudomonas sp. 43mfcvi1.1]|jgi:uncharacterized protein (DUF1778 family)|uniref:type II toxin-antitoxin system TacA family antitoxin n=1 Tax=Pseudomonas sp. 43mfcvi1.1 TaxID=1761894 RepID=UPI000D6D7474|nr:DUF1778 domain-containing protein [Pseudomonas sp. 43mfcvi1.1]